MKKILLILTIAFITANVMAQILGKIRFPVGDVQYRKDQNSPWRTAEINQDIEPNSQIKTGLDSSAEVIWNSNVTTTISAGKTVSMKTLYDEANKKQKWVTQVKEKTENMSLPSKQKAATVAGIRRDEVEIKSQGELFWDMEPLQSLDEAIRNFETNELTIAIPKFKKVIEQGPLKKDAEIAHSYLIMIYEEQKNTSAMKLQIEALRSDFPKSQILEFIPKDI